MSVISAEQRREAEHAVTRILAESTTLREATMRILQAICEKLNWDMGALWSVDKEACMLRFIESWHQPSIEFAEFEALSRESTFARGVGLPGHIWQSGEPVWIGDDVNHYNFPRVRVAVHEGLRSAFGFPVRLEGEMLAVMEFFSREARPPDQELLGTMSAIGSHMGQFMERKRAQEQLWIAHEKLEGRVEQRTYELAAANALLKEEIAERKRAEQALRAGEQMFRELVDMLPIAVYVCDSSGAIESYNKRAVELWGRAPNIRDIADGFCGSYRIYNLDGTYLPHAECPMAQVLRTGKTVSNEEIVIERPDGSRRTAMVNILPRRDERGNQTGAISCMADVTERKRAEQERTQLLQRLVTAQEDERYRIARELHDQTGQYLAALMLGLKSLNDCAPSSSPGSGGNSVKRLQEMTSQFSSEMRNFALELRPTSLDDLGLHTALANYVDQWSERYGIAVDFHSNGFIQQRLPPHIETALYRIVQEALTNVLKHAGAQRVSLILEYRSGRVLAVLEDDGCGFNVEAALDAPVAERGLGLTGMKERIELVGGTLEIESAPGAGTTLAMRISTAPHEGTSVQ